MDLQYKKIVQNFRLSIRRRQINEIFEKQRSYNQRQLQEQFKQTLSCKLVGEGGKQAWLHQIATKMSDEPNPQWNVLLKQLYYKIYDHRYDHEEWLKLGIVKSVCDLLKPQYVHLRLSKTAANIITDLLYINSSSPPNQTVIKTILNYQFAQYIIPLMIENADIQYIRLVGILFQAAPAIRNHFIKSQFTSFLQNIFIKIEGSYQQVSFQYLHSIFYLIQQILKVHPFDKDTFSAPKKSTILSLLPILNIQIQKRNTINNTVSILNSLIQIALLKKQQVLQQMLKYKNIKSKPIQMLNSAQDIIRCKSARLISNLLVIQNQNYIQILFDNFILDRIYDAYKLNDNKDLTKFMLLSLLSNISADNQIYQQKLIYHPIMVQIIKQQAFDSYNTQIRKQAVYNICNILTNIQQEWFHKLIQQLKIFDVLVNNIQRQDRDHQIMIDILRTWREMIIKQKQRGHSQNKYYLILTNYYNIVDILSEINQEDEIGDQITKFVLFMDNYYCD